METKKGKLFLFVLGRQATKVFINTHNVILIMDSPERKTQPTFYLTYIFVRKKVE